VLHNVTSQSNDNAGQKRQQMEIAVTQVSNGFIQSVRINRMMSPSDRAVELEPEPKQFWMMEPEPDI